MQLFDEGVDMAELDGDLYEGQRLYAVTIPHTSNRHYAVRDAGQSMDDFGAEVGLAMRRRYGQRVRFELDDITGAYRTWYLVWDHLAVGSPSYLCDDVEDALRVVYPEAFGDGPDDVDDPAYADTVRWVRDEAPHDGTIDPDASGLLVYEVCEGCEPEPLNTNVPYGGDIDKATDLRR